MYNHDWSLIGQQLHEIYNELCDHERKTIDMVYSQSVSYMTYALDGIPSPWHCFKILTKSLNIDWQLLYVLYFVSPGVQGLLHWLWSDLMGWFEDSEVCHVNEAFAQCNIFWSYFRLFIFISAKKKKCLCACIYFFLVCFK